MRRLTTISIAATLSLLVLAPGTAMRSGAAALAAETTVPRFGVGPLGPSLQPGATTIPTWSGSFTSNGTVYPYRMAGTNPAAGSAATTVPTEIIPLRVVFSDGAVHDRR